MKKARILSFGMNQMGDSYGIKPGIHAEQDAINKLQSLNNKKKLESINLLVIRLSSKNSLQSSKPCANCIESMKILPTKKGYKIQNIYYSDNTGNIIKTSLTSLDNEEKHYSRFYKQRYKQNNLNRQ
jgi:cytidine deaminase